MSRPVEIIWGVTYYLLCILPFAIIIFIIINNHSRMELIAEKCRAGDDTACQIIYDEER